MFCGKVSGNRDILNLWLKMEVRRVGWSCRHQRGDLLYQPLASYLRGGDMVPLAASCLRGVVVESSCEVAMESQVMGSS